MRRPLCFDVRLLTLAMWILIAGFPIFYFRIRPHGARIVSFGKYSATVLFQLGKSKILGNPIAACLRDDASDKAPKPL